MSEESPGRDWDALLNPTPLAYHQRRAAEHARARALWRTRAWSAFCAVVIVGIFIGWFALLPQLHQVPVVGDLIWFVVLLPSMCFVAYLILRRLERLVLPSAERELHLE